MSGETVPVQIKGLIPTPSGSGVFLNHDEKTIAIFVDPSVAAAIHMFLQKINKPRPLTHDLFGNVFTGLGVEVQKVLINDLKQDTFYARLFLRQTNEIGTAMVEIDSRPSDAIALALQQGCPIFVAKHVWATADDMSWAFEKALEDQKDKKEEDDLDEFLKNLEDPPDESDSGDSPGDNPSDNLGDNPGNNPSDTSNN